MQELLTGADNDFAAELREKQDELDRMNVALRDAGTALADARRKMQETQEKVTEKEELEQKIANLRRSNRELRGQLPPSGGKTPNGVPHNVSIGEADRGLDFEGRLASIEQIFPGGEENVDPNGPLSPDQRALLSSLERAEVLRGRVMAYQQHNADLENQAQDLKSRSQELEERYRKIVSICTGVEVDKVDNMLGNLVQAVESEQKDKLELGKVRDFLRMVHGTE
jgi:regulatory protein SWI6